uniref:Uncharacterized protein n=1 Tax=Tetranychus urticae TaxID=32264 RepID=T1JPW9_TETUR
MKIAFCFIVFTKFPTSPMIYRIIDFGFSGSNGHYISTNLP